MPNFNFRHRKKNLKILNKKRKAGITCEGTVFEQFVCATDIRWCYYSETQNILGQTFDICVLQDFEALTPNTLARTIETVSGGGLVIFLLKTMDSLRQLCTMAMDVHSRYRTDSHQEVVGRFNERFLLSLSSHPNCLVLDDRWRVLPISKRVLSALKPVPTSTSSEDEKLAELHKLKISLTEDGSPFAPLINICITLDQAKCLLQACASLATIQRHLQSSRKREKPLMSETQLNNIETLLHLHQRDSKSAVVLTTAARGRGKSASLGLALAAAVEAGLPNMNVTAPSPENVTTLFDFLIRGLKALDYEEHIDFHVMRALHQKNIVSAIEVVKRSYRQTICYVNPWDASQDSHLDLVCIDEAAAIPLPLVKRLISKNPRLVFLASTINGYEGTGRSLSLKLMQELREICPLAPESKMLNKSEDKPAGQNLNSLNASRVLYECELEDAIRYANGDATERWLNQLLCLDCCESLRAASSNGIFPPPDLCNLYYVNRDTLFAYHSATETFLRRLMALYVSGHYKNSPNDLQMLSDAPAHHIFCLLAPYEKESGHVPEVLCVVQVCFEGSITRDMVQRSLSRGLRPSGDLIPWTISQQFCSGDFGTLSGARIVRIATHPDYQSMGYGGRALKLLEQYFSGQIPLEKDLPKRKEEQSTEQVVPGADGSDQEQNDSDIDQPIEAELENGFAKKRKLKEDQEEEEAPILTEKFLAKKTESLPPLLSRLSERPAEKLHYLGVAFGATPSLIRFWKRAAYIPVYLRQSV
ncbi:N-acetyltransferase 10, partial [Cichlidogyrus casuarinus]